MLPLTAELQLPAGAEIVNGVNRQQLGQLSGRNSYLLDGGSRNDGTPDRVLARWLVRSLSAGGGADVTVTATHPRAGQQTRVITLV